jgi:hypothetical protein
LEHNLFEKQGNPGVNFINILRAAFTTVVLTFFLVLLGFASVKAACRTLMKFTPGINFSNILLAAFTREDPKSAKIGSSYLFCAFGICT